MTHGGPSPMMFGIGQAALIAGGVIGVGPIPISAGAPRVGDLVAVCSADSGTPGMTLSGTGWTSYFQSYFDPSGPTRYANLQWKVLTSTADITLSGSFAGPISWAVWRDANSMALVDQAASGVSVTFPTPAQSCVGMAIFTGNASGTASTAAAPTNFRRRLSGLIVGFDLEVFDATPPTAPGVKTLTGGYAAGNAIFALELRI